MRELTVAVLQLALARKDESENVAAVAALVEEAAGRGAQVILPPELFSGEYFCREEDEALFALARPTEAHPSVIAMQALAAKLKVLCAASELFHLVDASDTGGKGNGAHPVAACV